MSGLTAAIEAAEAGYDVYLVEKNPYLGGRVAQLHHYFPKLCQPYWGLEINFRRIKTNPRVRFFTMAEVKSISGEEGNFDVSLTLNPRYVNEKCTACAKCADACSMQIDNPFNYNMDKYVLTPSGQTAHQARDLEARVRALAGGTGARNGGR